MVVPASILVYFRLRGGSSMGVCVLCVYMCVCVFKHHVLYNMETSHYGLNWPPS